MLANLVAAACCQAGAHSLAEGAQRGCCVAHLLFTVTAYKLMCW
jgi:hypothetical protein